MERDESPANPRDPHPTGGPGDRSRQHPILQAVRAVGLQFLLPLAVFVPIVVEAEKLAEYLGYQGTPTQFLRIAVFVVFAMVIFIGILRKRS